MIELGKVTKPQNVVSTDNQPVTVDDLIVVRKGGKSYLQGTWLHPKLAIVFARWLSDEFAIWCDEIISDLLANGVVTLQAEDKKWVDMVESLSDRKPGNAWFMSQLREIIIIHETEGYNIKTFKDLLEVVRLVTDKEDQPKVFKKLRQLIKSMYEEGILGRTSHEAMLDLCVDTVVEVLEKQLKAEKSKLRRFTLKGEAPVIPVPEVIPSLVPAVIPSTAPSIAELTAAAKKEHDTTAHVGNGLVNSRSLECHKYFGLSVVESTVPVRSFYHGVTVPVADCLNLIKAAGYKVGLSNTCREKDRDSKEGTPDLKYRDGNTMIGVAFWFNDYNSSFTCRIQKSKKDSSGQWINTILMEFELTSKPAIDPTFFEGINKEGTMRVTLNTRSLYFMIYGRPDIKK